MLFRKHIVSTRTLLQLAVITILFVSGVGAALAANSGIAPLLVPYTINTVAGNTQYPTGLVAVPSGFAGEGSYATPSLIHQSGTAVMSAPYGQAIDSAGNIYITDGSNYIIREVNAQTGLMTTIGGVTPKGCSGSLCTQRLSGCADGVVAAGNPLGTGLEGIAVDAYGNVFFIDNPTGTVSVIYRGGTQIANFINLVNPGGVTTSGGKVLPGYVYHVGGTINLTTCTGTLGNVDGVAAFQNTAITGSSTGAQLHGPDFLFLDSADNIYIADASNSTVRVINTQATTQTFFQYQVQPGFMKALVGCGPITIPCASVYSGTTTATINTGVNGPANAVVFNSQFRSATADAWGNIYELNGTGSGTGPPGIYGEAAYAGGAPLTNLLTAEAPLLATSYGPKATPPNAPAELPLTYGNSYIAIDNPSVTSALPNNFTDVLAVTNQEFDVRPSSFLPDPFGTFYYNDNHYPEVNRIDQYTGLATDLIGSAHLRSTTTVTGIGSNFTAPASLTNPWYCVYGVSGHPWTSGPLSYDPQGDGCPAVLAYYLGGVHYTNSDGQGNLYLGDGGENIVRELSVGTEFPAVAVGTLSPLPTTCYISPCGSTGVQAGPVVQAIQVHFNATNPPQIGTPVNDAALTGNVTSAFTINGTSNYSPDFTIDTTDPEFPMGSLVNGNENAYGYNPTTSNFAMWAGAPTCTQLGVAPTATPVQDYDCLVYVSFNPSAPGVRTAQLTATTANGSVYNFPLYGVGVGGQLAVDGGTPSPVPATGLGTTAAIAVTSQGVAYIADPTNNRVVSCNPAATCAVQGTVGTGLKTPMGVAVDAAGNVYISDTGNNRVLEVNPVTSTQTVLGNNVWVSGDSSPYGTGTTPPPQYAFKAPQGLAVDVWNNVYVADTGNSAVVEIPSNNALGGAVPLLSYSGAPQFKNPVAIAVDGLGNIYVADTKNPSSQIVELPPGGGDLVNVPGTQYVDTPLGSGIKTPNGVAVDGAGNLYVSDSTANAVIEVPSASGPGSTPFALNFPGVSTPAGLALDGSGNLYVADTGNKQILFDNRQGPTVSFGNVPQSLAAGAEPICSGTIVSDGFNTGNTTPCVLTVTNFGNQPATLGATLLTVTGGNPAYSMTTTCTSPLPSGLTCTISPTFTPSADNQQGETVTVNAVTGTSPSLSFTANGQQPLVKIVLTSSSGLTPVAGGTDTITATVTQPHLTGVTPTGTVTFTYAIDVANNNVNSCGTGGTVTSPLSGSGGTATATFPLPTLAAGVQYTVTANYNGDTQNTSTQAAPILVAVQPATVETATVSSTAAQLTFTYGSAAPVPVGSVSPALPTGVTATFGSAAKATTPIGSYPVVVSFSGTNACSYGFPPSVFSGGGAAVVQENPAPLTYSIPNFTAAYGAPNISYGANAVITGAQNGDGFGATFTPPQSSVLNVGSYQVTPTVLGANVGNYTVTAKPSTLTVTKAGTALSISLAQTAVADTSAGVASAVVAISVGTVVPAGKGTPTGSVTLTDSFTPITATGLGTATSTTAVLPLTAGAASYTQTNVNPGLHQYSFVYSGDSNFQAVTVAPTAAQAPCAPSALAANCVLVDYPDFTLTSTTGPIAVNPGTIPSGNGLLPAPNQSTAYPETAVLFVTGVLGFSGQVNMSCTTPATYITCFMTPPAVSVSSSSKTAATVVAIETPATLPLGYKFNTAGLRTSATRTVLAFLPLGVLAFCVRRRRRLSKALWMLIAICAIGAGMSGCGGNQVDFYTPIPTGPTTVTVTATWPGNATEPAGTRSFVVPVNID